MPMREDVRVILGSILGGFVGGFAIATTWKVSSSKDVWDVFASLGSLAAALIALAALLAAAAGNRKRARDDLRQAKLVAARLEPELTISHGNLNNFILVASELLRQKEWTAAQYDALGIQLECARIEIPLPELTQLVPFLGESVDHVVNAAATVETIRHLHRQNAFLSKDHPDVLRSFVDIWKRMAIEAEEPLTKALVKCKFG